jgi:serine protease
MKAVSIKRTLITLLALLFLLGAVLPAAGVSQVRVWVEYRPGAQSAVQAELQRSGAQFHYHFERLGSYVVSVPEMALNGLSRNPNVVSVELDPVRELVKALPVESGVAVDSILPQQVVPYGIDMVQARDVWDANRDGKIDKKAPTGAGRTVCIIDTGYFSAHEDFQGIEVIGGYSQTNTDPALWTYDGYGHGTHVAGTVGAVHNDIGVVGVSPGTVSLFIVKIFDDLGEWVQVKHASDLVEAAYLCADNGAHIISMSLSGTTRSGREERAFNDLYARGVLSVAAASNDGIEKYHYPASYDSVISVAAIDSSYTVADFSQFNDQVELAAPGVNVLSTLPFIAEGYVLVDGVSYEALAIDFAPTGTASGPLVDGGRCLATGDWVDKVVLCERGDATFYDKYMNVQNSGGVAAVIYNNLPGSFSGTLGAGEGYVIPAVSLSQEDGQYLVANKLGQQAQVYSSIEFDASGYEAWSGTSMATPHVSGVAALIWSSNPALSNEQIRQAMQATALDLGDPGRDVYYGYGLVQAKEALDYLGGGKPGKGNK